MSECGAGESRPGEGRGAGLEARTLLRVGCGAILNTERGDKGGFKGGFDTERGDKGGLDSERGMRADLEC